ncbi:MAG: trypsin-like serine protease [Rhodobacteraceae bacterium]|nr:trypsin-like serine protease [Paracoccaceae bacterium]
MAENSGLIRLSDRDDLFGWEAVGRLDIGSDGYCTGVLIAPDVVLTAAHCVYDMYTGKKQTIGAFKFSAGLRDGKAIEERGAIKFIAHEDYYPRMGVTFNNIRNDVALIQLDEPISSFTAAPFKIHAGVTKGSKVSVVSYGQGRDKALSWQRECGMLGRRNGLMAFDCNVTHGSSGAPVFVKEGNRARILSLVSSGTRGNGQVLSWGMELPETVSMLKAKLRTLPAEAETKHRSTIRRLTVGKKRNETGAKFISN